MFDIVVVGAGFAGAVLAERLASQQNCKVLIIEKRHHIGGNCHDCFDAQGVLIHQYGPHLFHTSNKAVFHYLSQFTQWREYHHEVLAVVDGHKVPIPFNLNSIDRLFPAGLARSLEEKLLQCYAYGSKVPILDLRKENDPQLKFLADFIYDKVFANYTAKQWGCKVEEIAPEVTARVPVHISRDNRYFQDRYQAIPKQGYTRLFENMLAHPNISLMLNTEFRDIVTMDFSSQEMHLLGTPFKGHLIYSGLIDALFDYRFGRLPYRSLQFDFEYLAMPFFQEVTTVNYPNDYDYTRITEFKRISGQKLEGTTIVREYPQDYDCSDPRKNIPYYPVFTEDNAKKFDQYWQLAKQFEKLTLVGRLAENRYYDMDDIVERALQVYRDEFGS